MAKLYPPYLEGVLPAFSLNEGGGIFTIPFAHNKAVSINSDIGKYMAVKVKTVQNDVLIADFKAEWENGYVKIQYDENGNIIDAQTAKLQNWNLVISRYYKIQIAYLDKSNTVGYYSTVGVIKCTSRPKLSIKDFDESVVNNNKYEFIGIFEQPAENGDITEKVYSSKFIILDSNNNEILNTGDVLHNVENNPDSYSSIDTIFFNRDLDSNELYTIRYEVTTNNGLVASSPTYLLTQQKTVNMEFKGRLTASLNKDEGIVIIGLQGEEGEITNGSFVLSREDSTKPGYWDELYRFVLTYESPTKATLFKDFTVEQGKTYTYSIVQYNPYQVYSNRKKSNSIYVDFDDIFLYDGERQLKLEFNPQVSSFKTQLAESRTDTIGGQYPFFFRNARVGYKVFPISGLLSMLIDDNELFLNYSDILREDLSQHRHRSEVEIKKKKNLNLYTYTDLRDKNFASERLFKLAVLDWVNNGKVKLFRSPGEGNYLVRLMDASLTPQTGLGRMLHTLNATAYECATFNRQGLIDNNILKDYTTDSEIMSGQTLTTNWGEINFTKVQESIKQTINVENPIYTKRMNALILNENNISNNLILSDNEGNTVYTIELKFMDINPGTKFKIIFGTSGSVNSADSTEIIIGSTGNYEINNSVPIYGVYFLGDENNCQTIGDINISNISGSVMYQYKAMARSINPFNAIKETQIDIGSYIQKVGEANINQLISNIKFQATKIAVAKFHKRPVEFLYYRFKTEEENNLPDSIFDGVDEFGYRIIPEQYSIELAWDINFNRPFNDKTSKAYSPFCLYVLRKQNFTINNDNVINHVFNSEELPQIDDSESPHIANHWLEQYYIDRYLAAENSENYIAQNNDNIYILDAWTGIITNNFNYSPCIQYKNNFVDLREINELEFTNIDPDDGDIIIGNGVYAEVFYQKITTKYSFEDDLQTDDYFISFNNLRDLIGGDWKLNYNKQLTDNFAKYENAYDKYIIKINQLAEAWSKKED